ncbi:GyrI-like domain-containing protein [Geothrix campi]|jgi:effector-binding domain-containing protein|uniref:GyrI-like domain-containing protein n=1 Tax=Geothrix campi TaxID=2966450 RepID=UPI002147287E|nr:GyrI-like domain-containing protein [Geothrix sp. SG10]
MLDEPQIVQVTAQATAVIPFLIPRSAIQQVMGPGIQELLATLTTQGIVPTGPVFSHHFRMHADVFDFEIGVPIPSPVMPAGRVKPGQWPAGTVARTNYHGGYEGLSSAWGEFDAWLAAAGRTPARDLWECYATGPELGPDSAAWRTELIRPLLP